MSDFALAQWVLIVGQPPQLPARALATGPGLMTTPARPPARYPAVLTDRQTNTSALPGNTI